MADSTRDQDHPPQVSEGALGIAHLVLIMTLGVDLRRHEYILKTIFFVNLKHAAATF